MTNKELLYVEDAISHEMIIIDIINDAISNIEDDNLLTFMQKELKGHEQTKRELIKLLEVKKDER